MRKRVGEEIAAAYRCFSPPVDDLSAYADLGTTDQGIPVRVFRPVAEAGFFLVFCWLVCWWMYRKRVFVKI